MKKIVILLLIALCSATLLAQSNSYFQINGLIKNDLFKNEAMISDLATGLNSSEIMMLYNSNEMSATLPFVANFFLGAGIGSFIQGDKVGGTIGIVGELIGYSLIIGGALIPSRGNGQIDDSQRAVSMGLVYGGLATVIGVRIFEFVRPFSYAKKYNDTLFAALNNSYNTEVALVPVGNKVMAMASISF